MADGSFRRPNTESLVLTAAPGFPAPFSACPTSEAFRRWFCGRPGRGIPPCNDVGRSSRRERVGAKEEVEENVASRRQRQWGMSMRNVLVTVVLPFFFIRVANAALSVYYRGAIRVWFIYGIIVNVRNLD